MPNQTIQTSVSPATTPIDLVASLRMRDTAGPGWFNFRIISQPLFFKGIAYTFINGTITGFLMYLAFRGVITPRVKNFYSISIFVFLFMGGLHLAGLLTPRRALLIALNAAVALACDFIFFNNSRLIVLNFPATIWLMVCWLFTDPEIVAEFGLRRRYILRDLGFALALGATFTIYPAVGAYLYDFTLRVAPWENARHIASMLGQNIIAFGFIYLVWNHLQRRGLSVTGGIAVLLALNLSLGGSITLFAALGNATISFPAAMLGILGNAFLVTLVMTLTFRRYGNVLPVAFLVTGIHEILKMTGIL